MNNPEGAQDQNEIYEQIDPDYASNNIALKRAERIKEENVNSIDKLKEILKIEFNKDLSQRENQIEQIEKQIHKTQKLLHLMRYVLMTSYYNRDDLVQNEEESRSKQDSSYLFDQNRIHPALKKLLGKNATSSEFVMCRSARRNKLQHKQNLMVENLNDALLKSSTSSTSIQKSSDHHDELNINTQLANFDRNRQKIKNRIIVGNISKWIPSFEDDNLTHKWMMYVRGPKENPDVSHFIQKVVFYLHPSYKPHDVIEISEPPFHLSRRGWGEFPIRVQIYFKCALNKPVDIIHNLKLDKTYSGRQTLGNESIIDLYLYDDKSGGHVATSNFKEEKVEDMKHELVDFTEIYETSTVKSEVKPTVNAANEHDYITEELQSSEQFHMSEHSYCYSPLLENIKKEPDENPNSINQEHNELIYGLDDSYSEPPESSLKKEPLFYRKTFIYTTKQSTPVLKKREKVVQSKRKYEEPLLKTMFNNKMKADLEPSTSISSNVEITEEGHCKFQITLPRNNSGGTKFKNIGEALPYLFKRLPIISKLVRNPKYRSMYPFTAENLGEYFSWNVAKQSSAEWSRAKVIKKILMKEDIHEQQKWNTKVLMMYGQSHGYAPKINYNFFEKMTAECRLINACFSNSYPNSTLRNFEFDPLVDIENETDSSPKKMKFSPNFDMLSDPETQLQCSFVREEALECGVVLKNEIIDGDIVINGAQRMILEAVKCFANHLIRRSLHFSVVDGTHRTDDGEIKCSHVKNALQERKEFDALNQFRKKQTEIRYYFH